ncbi:hypothetical protein GCM10022414_16260 [Zhongshania borealis]|uniref:Uncharacterized protein n=1 Tax=Zhongshania borealis TaxID=889488 RepID=A0ABP7WQW4_9GAMM
MWQASGVRYVACMPSNTDNYMMESKAGARSWRSIMLIYKILFYINKVLFLGELSSFALVMPSINCHYWQNT